MDERKPPASDERVQQREIDPSAYSLSSNSKLLSESFEETNEIQSWQGGNTDFSDLGTEEPPAKIEKTKPTDVGLKHDE